MNNVNMPEVLETFKKDMETNAQIEDVQVTKRKTTTKR